MIQENQDPMGIEISLQARSRIRDVQNQDIHSSDLSQLIHDCRNLLLLDHRADRHPAFFLQGIDSGCTLAGGDFGSGLQVCAVDVVLA